MKMITREIRPSGRCIYRLGGVKLFSSKVKPAERIRACGRPVLVVRIPGDAVGIFCHFAYNLGWMRWAEERGYRCYVDMRKPSNVFNRGQRLPFNPWERFFRQACDAADVADAKEVLSITSPTPPEFPGVRPELYDQENPEFLSWREFTHGHIRFSDEMERAVDARQAELFGGEGKILGCLVRGTDYTKMKPAHHPVQPTPEQVIADAKRICAERGIGKVFLATEDRTIQDRFAQAFGSSLIINQTELPDYKSDYLVRSGALGDIESTMRISTQYFVSVALLSRCSCLLAGCASGAVGAALLSRGFDLMKVYNLGYYR